MLAFVLVATMSVAGDVRDRGEDREVVVKQESDNPWIWNGVHRVLREAKLKLEVDEIRHLIDYSIYTVEVRFKGCEPPLNVAQMTFNNGKWSVRKGTEITCRRPSN